MENKLLSPGQYTVAVKQSHLDEGKGNCTQLCVVALAIRDTDFFNRTPEYTDYISIMPSIVVMELNGRQGHSYVTEKYTMMMTGLCQDFIRQFDDFHRGVSHVTLPDPCTLKLFVLGDEFCHVAEHAKYNTIYDCSVDDDWFIDDDERKIVMAMMTSDCRDNAHQVGEIHDSLGVSDITSEMTLIKETIDAENK